MQPTVSITRQTPADVGDFVLNMLSLNQDCGDIADEISRIEDNASVLYNLAAATQNALRQQIRESMYVSTVSEFREEFINQNQISASTATLDFVAGSATAALITETVLSPTLAVGSNSVGTTTDDIGTLQTGTPTNLFTWTGELLEIIVTFPTATKINRLILVPDDYKGYEITSLTTSADGSLFNDVLNSLNVGSIVLNAAGGKYSGTTTVDFPPQSVVSMRIVLENRVDGTTIPLRSMSLTQRSYQATATITSTVQTSPTGLVVFSADQLVTSPYVSIAYQISSDGVNFTTIVPGPVTLPANWWYRALFSRSSNAFQAASQPLVQTTADPSYSSGFTLVSSATTTISPTTVERVLVIESITQPILLQDTPIPGTLSVRQGTVYLTPAQFTLDSGNNLSILITVSTVTVSYQTSAAGSVNTAALQPYYTAILREVTFSS